jgi:hypothetical protein
MQVLEVKWWKQLRARCENEVLEIEIVQRGIWLTELRSVLLKVESLSRAFLLFQPC